MTIPNFGTLSVASFWLEYLLDAALYQGCDLSSELVRLGVTDEQLESPQARIPLRVEHQLLVKALQETGDPLFGLHMGERIRPRFMGELGYASMSGTNLRQAIDLMVPFQRVTTEFAEAQVHREGNHVHLLWHTAFDEPVTTRHRVEAFFVGAVTFGRWISGTDENPVVVHFRHAMPVPDDAEYQRVFRCPVLFDQAENKVVLDEKLLDLPMKDADPEVHHIMRNRLQQAVTRYLARDNLLDQVRMEIRRQLERTIPQVENVAEGLDMKPWTLRRRLRAENTDFSTVLEEERRALASDWLIHSDRSVSQIAADLGYSEQSAFNRAFKRWFDTTPVAYRQERRKLR
ncbi:MAG: AraC family transcriptional regulator [Alcanivoracaceae bacterium]